MSRRLVVLQVLLVAAAVIAITYAGHVLSTAGAAERPRWAERFDRVRYRSLDWPRDAFSQYENRLSVHAAAVRFGVAEGLLICIVDRETGGTWNEFAANPTSDARGLFQQRLRYWQGRVDTYRAAMRDRPKLQIRDGVSVFNARANVLVSVRMIARGGLSHWGGGCGT